MIKQLLTLIFEKYRDLSVSRRSIIYLNLWQIIDLLATNKSRYFAQPRPLIVHKNWFYQQNNCSASASRFLVHLVHCTSTTPNATFNEGRGPHTTTIFPSLFEHG